MSVCLCLICKHIEWSYATNSKNQVEEYMTDHNFNSNHQVTSFETFTFEELGFNTFDVEIIRAMFKSKHGIERAKFFFGWQNTLYRTARNICTRKFSTHYVPDIAFAKIM